MSKELEELKSSISNWYGELKRSIGIDNINLIKKLIDEQALIQQEKLTKAVKEYFTLLNSDTINQDIIDRTDLLEETIKEMVGV